VTEQNLHRAQIGRRLIDNRGFGSSNECVPYSSQRSPIADGKARRAVNVLLSRDSATALLLVREKDRLRDLEKATSQSLFVRLRDGTPCSRNAAC
jgi:hypothetical protein